MTWFKVDDSFAFHRKVVKVGNASLGLWVRAGAWSAQQLTNGEIPLHMVRTLGGTSAHARALVDSRLWSDQEDHYLFNDWHKYQPTSAEVRAKRFGTSEVRVSAGRAGGIASGISRRANHEANHEANAKQNEANDAKQRRTPVPSRPDPTYKPAPPEPPRIDVETVCSVMAEVASRITNRQQKITPAWRTEARLLLDKDERSVDTIVNIIRWVEKDPFWRKNIHGIPKLRIKFDQLYASAGPAKRRCDPNKPYPEYLDNL